MVIGLGLYINLLTEKAHGQDICLYDDGMLSGGKRLDRERYFLQLDNQKSVFFPEKIPAFSPSSLRIYPLKKKP